MTRQRVHLPIGINRYEGQALAGCVNDALDWSTVFRDGGYRVLPPLLDKGATKEAILGTIDGLARTLKPGDRVAITYSGHGTWKPHPGGRDALEPDGRDEALVPVDYRSAGLILDDELYEALAGFRAGVRRLFVSDSCHSGTVTRSLARYADPLDMVAGVARFLPPAEWIGPDEPELFEAAVRAERTPAAGKPRPGAILLAACDDSEVAWDASIGGRPRGAYTAAAIDALTERPRNVQAWQRAIRKRLPSTTAFPYPQTPQLGASSWQRYSPGVL